MVDDPRHQLARAKEDIRELEKEVGELKKVAKRANKIAMEERDRALLQEAVIKSNLVNILSHAKKIKKKWRADTEIRDAGRKIEEIVLKLEGRIQQLSR